MDWAGAAAAFGALIGPLGVLAGVFYAYLRARINTLERENRDYLRIILRQSSESKETREALLRALGEKEADGTQSRWER